MRFDKRVAIVTGAGNGLGRAYAEFLGKRGANVLVNDLQASAADEVVKYLGGGDKAVANYNSVVDGQNIVDAALQKWGRVDILINNAGILRDNSFAKMTRQEWDDVYKVHLEGTMRMIKASWDGMMKQEFGRIVNVTSASGLYGNFGQANYSAMKLGIVGLTFTLSKEGAKRNILANVVAPLAKSQMTEKILPDELKDKLSPEDAAAFVAFLCHENCDRTGNVYEVGGGWVAQTRWQRSPGVVFSKNELNLETISSKMDEIENFDAEQTQYPRNLQDTVTYVKNILNA
ncbi:peroxisomal multifunctional enzyme type [Plasmopara halstedii]|uniref:Peroxisomal multifunctional enzyme type n=1 Tax=Plasmopara halstedii TaxID=4781 RepID=A0A0P1AT56_PLAHL|nr:peroxisomal multifunctional enzyme type [Plasmopara halstedii]CEG45361.1 peroxisomal multifunctional enzyme type [Plasmopara halstedii]|eukprot:XP_024581730.1 peroxisomal multifunctional enzyme type [Plasmopara halstedii]